MFYQEDQIIFIVTILTTNPKQSCLPVAGKQARSVTLSVEN